MSESKHCDDGGALQRLLRLSDLLGGFVDSWKGQEWRLYAAEQLLRSTKLSELNMLQSVLPPQLRALAFESEAL